MFIFTCHATSLTFAYSSDERYFFASFFRLSLLAFLMPMPPPPSA